MERDRISRGRLLLRLQRRDRSGLPPLPDSPPKHFSSAEAKAREEILRACPIRAALRNLDEPMLSLAATCVVKWRAGHGVSDPELLREAYRLLGKFFLPMPERRRLLFPDRPRRR